MRLRAAPRIDPKYAGMEIVIPLEKGQSLQSIMQDISGLDKVDIKKDFDIKIAPKRKKRSLDANAYFWVLCDKLAAHNKVTVSDTYRELVREIGGNSDIVCMKDDAVPAFCHCWASKGEGWQTEAFPSKIEGCTNVKVYYGSSSYNTEQMSRLIDLTVAECKEAGIETMTPQQLEQLKAAWQNR